MNEHLFSFASRPISMTDFCETNQFVIHVMTRQKNQPTTVGAIVDSVRWNTHGRASNCRQEQEIFRHTMQTPGIIQ